MMSTSVDYKSSFDSSDDVNTEFGGTEARRVLEKKLLRKLDIRMSILVLIYILNYIDRNNVGAARLRGFEDDLHLKGQEFATLFSILYVGYILMQIPSNMLLNYFGKPSLHLPFCMIIWGMLSCLTGIAKDFNGALITRFFVGFTEAAFFPGALFLLSKWYKREELGLRTAVLYGGNIISNAFGALIASGILGGMDGKLGHAAWRWLFYIEGSLTIFIAVIAIFVLPDFPATTRWLSPQERALALKRMVEDAGVGDQMETEGHGSGLWLAITDWKVWWLTALTTSQIIAQSFNNYFPTLTATLGYNSTISLLLVAPPFITAALLSFFWCRHSDQTRERFWHVASSLGLGIVGFFISMSTMNVAARYVSMFMMAQTYVGLTIIYAWINNSLPRPPSKRAAALALINAVGQLGNIAGSYIWPQNWGPTYRFSFAICAASSGLALVMCWIFKEHLKRMNKRLEQADDGTLGREFRYIL